MKGGEYGMRNILITVMMLAVVAFLFLTIIMDDEGIQKGITDQGTRAVTKINDLKPGESGS